MRRASLAAVLVFVVAALGAALAPAAQAAQAAQTRQTARAADVRDTRGLRTLPTASELRRCRPDRQNAVVCVDLNAQRLWVMRGRTVVFGPVTVRTGRRGHLTRTGSFRIYWRHQHHWSSMYDAPMPYSQFFSRGEALHGIYDDIHSGAGSEGCVNLTVHDAARLWPLTRRGTVVEVWGHKPGT